MSPGAGSVIVHPPSESGRDDYIDDVKRNLKINTQGIGDKQKEYLNYLAMHVSAQVVLQSSKKTFKENKMVLMNAEKKGNP